MRKLNFVCSLKNKAKWHIYYTFAILLLPLLIGVSPSQATTIYTYTLAKDTEVSRYYQAGENGIGDLIDITDLNFVFTSSNGKIESFSIWGSFVNRESQETASFDLAVYSSLLNTELDVEANGYISANIASGVENAGTVQFGEDIYLADILLASNINSAVGLGEYANPLMIGFNAFGPEGYAKFSTWIQTSRGTVDLLAYLQLESATEVPEPATSFLLAMSGILGLGVRKKKTNKPI